MYFTLKFTLNVLTNDGRDGLRVVAFDRFHFKLFTMRFANKIIVCKHGINVGLRHTFHTIHLAKTTVLYNR
jgi:hypothetical protein